MGCYQSTLFDPEPCPSTNHQKSSGTFSLHSACREVKRGVKVSMGVLGRRKSRAQRRSDEDGWLLAHSDEHLETQSVHSSFRFTLVSSSPQDELEPLEPSSSLNSPSGAAATVLMMNLEAGSSGRPDRWPDLKPQVVESLERSISPAAAAAALVRFSYGEIRSATNGFSAERVLGRGALSCVFKGRFRLGRTVAIKRLDNEDKESPKAFCRELMIAGSLDHPNVVRLIGFCIDPAGLFLVYKYVSGGSLEQHLHGGSKSTLSWPTRYKIAIGVAQALAYLHYGTKKCVIHRDIKPSNILLSSKMTPKLCDFGLATVTAAPSAPFLCKTVKGTFGYLAPEYFQHGKVSDRTDVYAFGVVLLELITGRKPINTEGSQGEENMVCWAKLRLLQEDSAADLLDPRLKKHGFHNRTQVAQMAHAASACLNADELHRPTIDKVLAVLQGSEHFTPCKSSFLAKASFSCYPHLHSEQAKCEMSSHLALAMMGVNDVDDDDIFER